jgi:hypothetical protein
MLLATGCPAVDDDDSAEPTPAPTHGTLAVSFGIDDDWAAQMDEPAVGGFWGTIFWADEVSGIGPEDDAEELGSIYVEVVDMTGPTLATDVLFTTEPLLAGWVTILGFVDSDANSTEADRGPDENDPVTLPNDNQFEVIAGQESPAQVYFDFLNP